MMVSLHVHRNVSVKIVLPCMLCPNFKNLNLAKIGLIGASVEA